MQYAHPVPLKPQARVYDHQKEFGAAVPEAAELRAWKKRELKRANELDKRHPDRTRWG